MRRGFRTILIGLSAAFMVEAIAVTSFPAAARDLTAVERISLARTVGRFDAAMRTKNIPVVIDIVPPRVVAHIAAQAGVDRRRLRSVMIRQTREVMDAAVIRAFAMDVSRARYGATANGTPYALIPTTATIRMGDQEVTKASNTLAMQDGGHWYLLDLNEASRVAIFTQVYPEFRGVAFGG